MTPEDTPASCGLHRHDSNVNDTPRNAGQRYRGHGEPPFPAFLFSAYSR